MKCVSSRFSLEEAPGKSPHARWSQSQWYPLGQSCCCKFNKAICVDPLQLQHVEFTTAGLSERIPPTRDLLDLLQHLQQEMGGSHADVHSEGAFSPRRVAMTRARSCNAFVDIFESMACRQLPTLPPRERWGPRQKIFS